ncbi:negative regulator of beta-lactamase [Saccharomonospora sp. CUA-673]|uniref:peptidoglycan recognition protein family protein n=1 Tax=Saccharomonospora sp. CUA-673 TaxID=1904969 RepID=UPI000964F9BA|nr:N-acetylmuramoyl-L-alanine amidase [Saccharomonospora sp. CUA-673]OLT48360.1 negative regulator of beta-lactamase [Saccharomonospora sp. CUA-673]
MSDQPAFHRRTFFKGGLAVTAAGALTTLAPAAASAAVGSGSTSGGVGARAAEPTIHTTADWGAQSPTQDPIILDHAPTYIVVHHTAGSNSTDYSLDRAYTISRSIQQLHMDNGWGDSGQQFTNSRGGHITEGRHHSLDAVQGGTQHVQGAHVANNNSTCIGIENEGIYVDVDVTEALWNSLVDLVAWIAAQYGLGTDSILGHRDFNSTECPGTVLYGRLPELRDAVGARLGARSAEPTSWPLLTPGDAGPQVRTAQTLLRDRGVNVAKDGVFTAAMAREVAKFKRANGVTQLACGAAVHRNADESGFLGSDVWPLLVSGAEREDMKGRLARIG